ncbi:hypothetical protein MJT46_009818 [Ovis ammon polii x Ovis aries]|nr:hypothetical protein MJT46_009818 [Ovis ammon polii x Ovis aries]
MTTSWTRCGGLRKGQSPCEYLGGLSGFLSRRCRGLRPCVESGPEPEDSSPVLTWILGCDGNAGNSFPTKQGKDSSSRARRRKRGSPGCVRDLRASSRVETGLSHVHTWWDSILGLNVKAVQGKQVPLEWTDTSGGLLEWWHDPGVPLAFPVESATSSDATGTPGILSLRNMERIPHLEQEGGNGAPLDVCRTFVLPLEWRRVCRELLELQQGCEGPFRSSSG